MYIPLVCCTSLWLVHWGGVVRGQVVLQCDMFMSLHLCLLVVCGEVSLCVLGSLHWLSCPLQQYCTV